MRVAVSFLILSFVFSSCGDKKDINDFGIGKNLPESIIINHLLFSSFAQQSSFPVWFSDSLIQDKKISTITRKIYGLGQIVAENDSIGMLPVRSIKYSFHKSGKIRQVEEIMTRDNQVISHVVKKYGRLNETVGFAPLKITKNTSFNENKDKSNDIPVYQIKKIAKEYNQFKKKQSEEKLFVINDESMWGGFQINKKLRPFPTDKLILGTMYFPVKSYSVKNTIEESDVEKFKYEKKVISEIVSVDLPFQTKRSFQYDRRGYCTSYVDSLFSDDEYLSRTVSVFTNNMHFSPIKIVHEKENMDGEKSFHYFEKFEYEYRK